MSVNRTQLQAVLAEEGLEHDAALLRTLEGLAALRPTSVPAPTGPLAELLASAAAAAAAAGGSATAPLAVVRETPPAGAAAVVPLTRAAALKAEAAARPRWIKRHRGAMIGALVVAGMGLGASGVAALGGQGWDWQGGHSSVVSPASVHDTESPGSGSPAAVPSTDGRSPAQNEGGNSQGSAQDAQGQDLQNAQGQDSHNAQSQDQQSQNPAGSDQARHHPGGAGRPGQGTGQGGSSQGGGSQGGNSQGSGS